MRDSLSAIIVVALISIGVVGTVVYGLLAPHIDSELVSRVTMLCAATPLLLGGIAVVFLGIAWLDGRRSAREQRIDHRRAQTLYRERQEAQQVMMDASVMRSVMGAVDAGFRAQLTQAKLGNEQAKLIAPPADDVQWIVPDWAEIDD